MSTMIDRDILQTLQTATIAAVAASILPTLPVKYVGRTQPIPEDQKWLEAIFIPNNRIGDHWGDEKNYQGMFRLILHWPNRDEGAYEPMDVLASVCSYFSKGTALQNVRISDNPNLTGVLEEGSENLFPASIRYQRFEP